MAMLALLAGLSSGLLINYDAELAMEPPHIDHLYTLQLDNHTMAGSMFVQLSACGKVLLPRDAVLGFAEGGANEEWVRVRGVCTCSSECALVSALHYEHGELEPVSLMPSAFQPPAPGQRLNALPEPFASPEHERAAAIVARAQRWLTLSAENVGGSANKLPLRRLLMGLTLLLLGGGCCAVALRCLLGAIARANMKR